MNCETVVIEDSPIIYIDKNNPDPIIPDWVYTAEPGEVVRQLISDGMPHMAHEVHVILGRLYADDSELEKLVKYVGGQTLMMNQKMWIAKKELTLYEANLSTCIGKILDMYENESKHSVSEIKNKIDRVMPKDSVTLIDILSRVRLIFFLRNTQECLRTTYSKDPKIDNNHKIRITKFDEPFIPAWIYTADTLPGTSLKMLISDGVKHSYKELYAIFGDFIDKPESFTKLLDIADAMLVEDKKRSETFVMAKTVTALQERFGQCVQKVIDMYEKDECHSYQEILDEVIDIIPSEYTIDQVLEDAKLILYLRNRSIKGPHTTSKIDDSGERMSYGEDKAVREPSDGKGRFDLITPFGLERLAKWYELGAKKYSDRNWEKRIPFSRYFDSAMRHMSKFIMGRTDEDHLAAAVWNLMAIMHHQELGQTELDDLPHYIKEDRDA